MRINRLTLLENLYPQVKGKSLQGWLATDAVVMETKRKILLFSTLHVIQVKQSNSVLHHRPTTAGDIRYVKRRFTQKEGEVFMPRPNQLILQLPPTKNSTVICHMQLQFCQREALHLTSLIVGVQCCQLVCIYF